VARDGRYEVIADEYGDFFGPAHTTLLLRTSEGIRSRRAVKSMACFAGPDSEAGSAWILGRVEFVDEKTLVIHSAGSDTWTMNINWNSLTASIYVDRCSGAPDNSD